MRSFIGWIIITCAVVVVIGGLLYFTESAKSGPPVFQAATTTLPDTAVATDAPSLPAPNVPDGFVEYRNDDYGFSIYYPKELTPKETHDEGYALTVLFQGAPGDPGFQIYAAPMNGTKVSAERFQMDEPSGIMEEPHNLTIDGVSALTFYGFDAKVGKTSELWFSKNGFLFEVTSYKELSGWLSDIMQSWRFTTPKTHQ